MKFLSGLLTILNSEFLGSLVALLFCAVLAVVVYCSLRILHFKVILKGKQYRLPEEVDIWDIFKNAPMAGSQGVKRPFDYDRDTNDANS